ncbi:FAD-binding oxidoreductase [Mycobacterium sp. URHB0021]
MSPTHGGPRSWDYAETVHLAAQVAGPVLLPYEAGYRVECDTSNLWTPVRPAVAVGALSVVDVQAAVRFAAERDLPVAVLATGHQVARAAEDSVLINVSRMNVRFLDPTRRFARVEGGARWQQVLDLTDKHGLAAISGSSGDVGVVGYHLGGGASPILGRTHGYAADHVRAIEIVTADGDLRRVTADSEPDLFWALRGGKGNFGVVTALEFSLFPARSVYGGVLVFAGEDAAEVLHTWQEWAVDLPEEISSSVAFVRWPPMPTVPEPLRGRLVIQVRFSSLLPRKDAAPVLTPIRMIGPTILDTISEHGYPNSGSAFMDPPMPIARVQRAISLQAFPSVAADVVLDMLGSESNIHLRFVELCRLGGALQRQPAVPNAVPGRDARWSLFGSGGGRRDMTAVFDEQLTTLIDALSPWAQDEIMPNLLGAGQGTTARELRAIYGPARYDRLAAIKARYDPRNLFRMNHNIAPEDTASPKTRGDKR